MASRSIAAGIVDEAPSPAPAAPVDSGAALPARLAPLAETARDYARAATSPNTNRAYAADWRHYSAWAGGRTSLPCPRILRSSASTSPPAPPARPARSRKMLGQHDRAAAVGAHVEFCPTRPADGPQGPARRDGAGRHPPHPGAAARAEGGRAARGPAGDDRDPRSRDLRGLRDRAILLIGFAGGLRRSEIVGLDCRAEDGLSGGWIEFFDDGLLLTLRGKTGWREVEIGRGSSEATCPVVALETWLKFARISVGPLFRRVVGGKVGADRLTDRHVARLVKQTALAAGVRGDLTEGEREKKFSGHSLRAGLASSAEVDERYVQKQLGHASAEMTRRYQRRRDRFRVNLTKAAGL